MAGTSFVDCMHCKDVKSYVCMPQASSANSSITVSKVRRYSGRIFWHRRISISGAGGGGEDE